MAVSVDATKVREKLAEEITSRGENRYDIGFVNDRLNHSTGHFQKTSIIFQVW